MSTIVSQPTYNEFLEQLKLFEPTRSWWTAAAGLALIAAAPTLALGGFVLGAYLAGIYTGRSESFSVRL